MTRTIEDLRFPLATPYRDPEPHEIRVTGRVVIPLCERCGHKATMHAVDDEERRECMEFSCACEQFEKFIGGVVIREGSIE